MHVYVRTQYVRTYAHYQYSKVRRTVPHLYVTVHPTVRTVPVLYEGDNASLATTIITGNTPEHRFNTFQSPTVTR